MSALTTDPQFQIVGMAIAWWDAAGHEVQPFSDQAATVDVAYRHGVTRHRWEATP